MRLLPRSAAVQITCGILLLTSCVLATPKSGPAAKDDGDTDTLLENETATNTDHNKKQLEDEIDLDDAFDAEQLTNEQLPILPPIILLDFVNGTDDASDSNSTASGDEKAKRTIDGSLGYGYNQNNLFSGKHNFYFPAGKTGTAVSIEESISPFEPKTVTELIKPITEKSENDGNQDVTTRKPASFESLPDPLPLQNGREPLPVYPPYPIFGQRTKLQKTSSLDGRPQTKPFTGTYTTGAPPGSETYNKLIAAYTSMRPTGYQTGSTEGFSGSPNVNGYARPMTAPFIATYASDIYSSSSNQKPAFEFKANPSQTSNNNQELNLANYPRFTIENGVKYEHKIVWKYPDGKISETPPASYVNSYSEYADQQKVNQPITNGFRPSAQYQSRPGASAQPQSAALTNYVPFTGNAQSNIYSQRPVQFPIDQEQQNGNQQKDQTRFVSASIKTAAPAHLETSSYTSYHGQFGLRQNPKLNNYRPITSHKVHYTNHNAHRPLQRYPVSGPDSEYAYHGENSQTENLFMPNGQLNRQVLAKYSPEAQQYLMRVFAKAASKQQEYQVSQSTQTKAPPAYQNSDYSNLLNYNPSISQYIKDPSSILNAQPTFVQAGNSLIPVIILRVDGTPPIQPKVGSNINLKALLRQYLTQYANSVSKVTQNTNYDLGSGIVEEQVSASQQNPVEDLKYLTESLASLRQRGHQDPDFVAASYNRQYGHHPQVTQQQNAGPGQDFSANYNGFVKDYQKIHASQQGTKSPQKVKNVQIIEDPRYTSYKVDN